MLDEFFRSLATNWAIAFWASQQFGVSFAISKVVATRTISVGLPQASLPGRARRILEGPPFNVVPPALSFRITPV
jgi:hypothetical protein